MEEETKELFQSTPQVSRDPPSLKALEPPKFNENFMMDEMDDI